MNRIDPSEYHAQLLEIAHTDLRIALEDVKRISALRPTTPDPQFEIHLDRFKVNLENVRAVCDWLEATAPNEQFDIYPNQ